MVKRIAVTPGEPAGVGPDLIVRIAQQAWPIEIVVVASKELLLERAESLGLPLQIEEYDQDKPPSAQKAGTLTLLPLELAEPVVPGKLNVNNGAYVVESLRLASEKNISGEFDAVVTGPVHKELINKAGIPFSGHTEYLAELTNTPKTVMLLATDQLRVALATTHLALNDVSNNITQESLSKVITIINNDFKYFGIKKPRILVCGLNPHAGENGYLGDEEITTIIPVINKLKKAGFNLTGPVPADTAFTPDSLKNIDVVLAMYHDQGLPVLKAKGFKNAANITLGLPFIRTSVDHGTALDLAGTGNISLGSFETALSYFNTLSGNVSQS